MRKKIAFIKEGSFSHINRPVADLLCQSFPQYEVEEIDVLSDILKRRRVALLMNWLHVLRCYGGDILRRRRTMLDSLFRTPYIFNQIKRQIDAYIRSRLSDYAFSFQTQSQYDASVPDLPHFVYTDHTHLANLDYPDFDPDQLFARSWITLERTIYLNATKTFTMSQHVKRSIIEQYGCDPNRVSCVFAGSNAVTDSTPLDNAGHANGNILFVGVEWERKGGPELEEAFKLVLQKHPRATLTIVGCSPTINLPNCRIAGYVGLDKVSAFFSQASVFCLPSRIEPFGIACVEAFMHKLPVVASRIGALPDLIEDGQTGRLVSPGNSRQLADALCDLLGNPQKCQRLGEAGYTLVRDRYTWPAVGARLKKEIEESLSRAGTDTRHQ